MCTTCGSIGKILMAGVPDRVARRYFSTSCLRANRYPEVSQKIMSATACRYFVLWLANVMMRIGTVAGTAPMQDHDQWAVCCVQSLALMETIQLQHGRFLSAAAAGQMQTAYMRFRAALNSLAVHAVSEGLLRYHMRPKLHQLDHLILDFLPANPRYMANYLNEDFVKRAKILAAKSHPAFMAQHVCFRYTLQACLRWR